MRLLHNRRRGWTHSEVVATLATSTSGDRATFYRCLVNMMGVGLLKRIGREVDGQLVWHYYAPGAYALTLSEALQALRSSRDSYAYIEHRGRGPSIGKCDLKQTATLKLHEIASGNWRLVELQAWGMR